MALLDFNIGLSSIESGVQKGTLLPIKTIGNLFNGNSPDALAMRERELKGRIFAFLRKRERIFLSDIIDKFDITQELALKLLNELEEEGKIKNLD